MKKKHNRFQKKIKKFYKKSQRTFHLTARKITLIIIAAVAFLVGIAILLSVIFSAENTTKRQIESMAKDYYETFFYENFTKNSGGEISAFEKYAEKGFAKVTLRQLLLFDGGRYKNLTENLTEYCNEGLTTVKFYPVEPYGTKNYKIEYDYSCNF